MSPSFSRRSRSSDRSQSSSRRVVRALVGRRRRQSSAASSVRRRRARRRGRRRRHGRRSTGGVDCVVRGRSRRRGARRWRCDGLSRLLLSVVVRSAVGSAGGRDGARLRWPVGASAHGGRSVRALSAVLGCRAFAGRRLRALPRSASARRLLAAAVGRGPGGVCFLRWLRVCFFGCWRVGRRRAPARSRRCRRRSGCAGSGSPLRCALGGVALLLGLGGRRARGRVVADHVELLAHRPQVRGGPVEEHADREGDAADREDHAGARRAASSAAGRTARSSRRPACSCSSAGAGS